MSDRLSLLASWVEVPSTSGDEAAFTDLLDAQLRADGLTVRRLPVSESRSNLLATWGESDGQLDTLLCSHLDTVPPHIPPRVEGETLYGRGACDAKGCLLAMREALLEMRGVPGVGLLAVVGEETDHAGAKAARDQVRCRQLVLGEPTVNRFLPAQKGVLKLRFQARGVAAHSAFPARGASAIHRLVRHLSLALDAPLVHDPVLGETTWNVGRISGGVADNVFAPEAEATAMLRVVRPAREVFEALAAACPDEVAAEYLSGNDPLMLAVPSWGERGEVAAFNTDGPYMRGRFEQAYLVGPGDIQDAHGDHERVTEPALAEAARIYRRLAAGDEA